MYYRLFIQRIGAVGLLNLIISLRNILLIPLLTKSLGAFEYGIWSQINITITLLSLIVVMGLTQAEVRFLSCSKNKEDLQEGLYSILISVLVSSLMLSIILLVFSDLLAIEILDDVIFRNLVILVGPIVLFSAANSILLAFLTATMRFKAYTILNLIQKSFELFFPFAAILLGYSISGVITSLFVCNFLFFSVISLYIISIIGIKIPRFLNLSVYLRFSLPLIPTLIFVWIIHGSDRYIIGYLMGTIPVGIYSVAYGIASIIQLAFSPIGLVLFPTITQLWDEKNIPEAEKFLNLSLKYYLMIAIPSSLGLFVLSKPLISILSTPEFILGSDLVPVIAIGFIFYQLYSTYHYVLYSVKKTKMIASVMLFASLFNIIITIIFVKLGGLMGAAMSSMITYLIIGILITYMTSSFININIEPKFLLKCLFSSMIMCIFISIYTPNSIIDIIIAIVLGIFIYFLFLYIFKGIKNQEMDFIKECFRIKAK